MDASDRPHRDRARTHLDVRPGGGFLTARFVIRFDLPDTDGPFYATRHPDPPHDWAMTHVHELARAVTFDTYDHAVHVLDFDYGRRTNRRVFAQGHYGRVVILGEEIRGLTDLATAAMNDLRAVVS